jgi:ABC-type lipoprotein release transport system permease subunit
VNGGRYSAISNQFSVFSRQPGDFLLVDYSSRVTDFGAPGLEPQLLSDAAALRADYGNHLLSQQILGLFRLNVWLLVGLSFTSLLLLQLLDGWRRRPSWGTLMTIGVSRWEVARVMINEGMVLVGLGLAVGVGLGLVLARISLPLLTVTLSASMGGSETAPLLLDWLHLGWLLLMMAVLYGVGIIVPAWAIGRVEVARLLRWQL